MSPEQKENVGRSLRLHCWANDGSRRRLGAGSSTLYPVAHSLTRRFGVSHWTLHKVSFLHQAPWPGNAAGSRYSRLLKSRLNQIKSGNDKRFSLPAVHICSDGAGRYVMVRNVTQLSCIMWIITLDALVEHAKTLTCGASRVIPCRF